MSTTEAPYRLISAGTGEPARLSMQRLWLTGQVLPAGARLTVEHVFRSGEAGPLEVVYSFPLPRDAALRSFVISGEGFDIHSELRDTESAVQAYEKAIAAGTLAALARQYGDGVINLTVGNIRPDEMVTVRLEILAGVELRDDGFRFRFPFTLAPGYHARARMADGETELPANEFGDVLLPPVRRDASRLHEVGFDLSLVSQVDFVEIGSPSHTVILRQEGPRARRITLAQDADVPNRDLVLDARFAGNSTQILAANGHFAAVLPSTAFGANPNTARRVVILLDRSGSMSGKPLDQAVKAIRACLAALSEQDLFGLVAFDDQVETFHSELLPGSRANRDKAQMFLGQIGARGGTELVGGFNEAVRILQGGDVLVLTDGQVSGTEAILARARAANTRLHCLGIGSASQDRFLALLARETGGVSRFVTPRERVDLCAVDLFASIGRPVASGLKVEGNVDPPAPSSVFSGTPVLLFGEGAGVVQAAWDGGQLQVPISYEEDHALGETIRLLQGARLITDWDSRYPATEALQPLEKRKQSRAAARLRELSERYGLASREMSLVAVVQRNGDRPGELPETRIVPVGMPQDTRFDACFGAVSGMLAGAPQDVFASLMMMAPVQSHLSSAPGVLEEAAELSGPSGHPQRRFSRLRKAFSRRHDEQSDDLLIEIAGRIEPDGGMPGRDADERVGSTIVALLAFLSQGHTEQSGAFRGHVARLIGFLKALLPGLPPRRARVLAAVLSAANHGRTPSGDWLKMSAKPENCWKHIERAFAEAGI